MALDLKSFSNTPHPSLELTVRVFGTGRNQKPVWGSGEEIKQMGSGQLPGNQVLTFTGVWLSGSFSKCCGLIRHHCGHNIFTLQWMCKTRNKCPAYSSVNVSLPSLMKHLLDYSSEYMANRDKNETETPHSMVERLWVTPPLSAPGLTGLRVWYQAYCVVLEWRVLVEIIG